METPTKAIFTGEYLAEDEETSEIKITVSLDPSKKDIKGSEFSGKKKI